MRTKIVKRDYVDGEGKSLLYLHATKAGKRLRLPIDIYVRSEFWLKDKSRMKPVDKAAEDINMMIGLIETKVNTIKITYRLSEKALSLSKFKEEFLRGIPRIDFISFMSYQLDQEKQVLAAGTIRRHEAVIEKLKEWKKEIYFSELDENFPNKVRSRLKSIGNSSVTIESNMASIKKFISAAEKSGIRFALKSKEIKIGCTNGNRTDLKPQEVHKVYRYYTSEFVNPRHKRVAGYFLFACFTGLRISDVQQLERHQFVEDNFSFISRKTKKRQLINISTKLRAILDEEPTLFLDKVSDVEINRTLKDIAHACGIRKRLTFHVARHTFATNFLRMGGDAVTLKKLLNHSKFEETMIYVHIVEAEACEKIKLMDEMW